MSAFPIAVIMARRRLSRRRVVEAWEAADVVAAFAADAQADAAIVPLALSFGHIDMGMVGAEGASETMRSGRVDETWAKEHHAIWYEALTAGRSGRG